MRSLKSILVVLLLFCCCFSGCSVSPDVPEGKSKSLPFIEDGKSDYVMIVPSGNQRAFDAASRLSQTISDRFGVLIPVRNDGVAEQEKEILIGKVNRSAVNEAYDRLLTPRDFHVGLAGRKLVILSVHPDSLEQAVSLFAEEIINRTDAASDTVCYTEGQIGDHYAGDSYRMLLSNGKSDYRIIAGQGDTDALAAAKDFSERIRRITGVMLPVFDDSCDAVPKEILIGRTNRTESTEALKLSASKYAFTIRAAGEKLVLASESAEGVLNGINCFFEKIDFFFFKETLMLETNYQYIGKPQKDQIGTLISSIRRTFTEIDHQVPVETSDIYVPGTEKDFYFSHHQYITCFKGRYYAFWSNGRVHEDDCGQRIMMAESDDFKTWTCRPLVDSMQGKDSELVLCCGGTYLHDSVLTVYLFAWEYEKNALRVNEDGSYLRPPTDSNRMNLATFYTQTTDGKTWSTPERLCDMNAWNQSPSPLQSGRLLWPGMVRHAYSDDPSGIGKWSFSSLPSTDALNKAKVCEGAYYQTPDGTVIMLQRADADPFIWCAVSLDDGKTWSEAQRTALPNSYSKFSTGRLPDGRYYLVCNLSRARDELVLMTSENGIDFNRCYFLADEEYTIMKKGQAKAGDYGYPTVCITGDSLVIVYSRGKESVQALRVRLSDLK